jgi:hypothetical protein
LVKLWHREVAEMIDRHWNGIALCSESDNQVSLGFVEGLNNKTCVTKEGRTACETRTCA